MATKLARAITVINTTRRGKFDPPLLTLATCDKCDGEFALLSQHARSAAKLCRTCIPEQRREARRR